MTRCAPVELTGKYRRAAYDEVAVFPSFFNRLFQQPLAACKLHSRQEFPIREVGDVFVRPAHADELFNAVVIRRKLVVAYGPVVAEPIAARSFQFIIREAIALAAPGN